MSDQHTIRTVAQQEAELIDLRRRLAEVDCGEACPVATRLRAERDEARAQRNTAQADAEADNAEAIRSRAERDRAREASAAAFADLAEAGRLCAMRDEYPLKAVQRVAASEARLREALRGLVSVVSARLARGEDTEPGDFERAWQTACAALGEGTP